MKIHRVPYNILYLIISQQISPHYYIGHWNKIICCGFSTKHEEKTSFIFIFILFYFAHLSYNWCLPIHSRTTCNIIICTSCQQAPFVVLFPTPNDEKHTIKFNVLTHGYFCFQI